MQYVLHTLTEISVLFNVLCALIMFQIISNQPTSFQVSELLIFGYPKQGTKSSLQATLTALKELSFLY